MIKYIIFNLLICVSVVNANNCKNFLTMEGNGQQMSIMLCMNTNFPQSSTISKTNLSNSTINNRTKFTNKTSPTNITLGSYDLFNTTNNSNIPFVESATTLNITTPSSITTLPPTTPSISPSSTTPSTSHTVPLNIDTSTNLRGVNSSQNTTNNNKLQKKQQPVDETTLESGLIVVIVLCSCVTLFSVIVLIMVLCNHKKCCKKKDKATEKNETNDDIEAQSLKKPKGRRVSPTNEKIEQFQYTNTYRNSQKLKRGTNTLKAVERLKHFRENREHKNGNKDSYPPVPPGMNNMPSNNLPNLPPRLPPPAPNTAMKQAHKIMERKNRNSWSIKEIPTNANGLSQKSTEVDTDKILKTKGSHNLGLSKQ